jgi:hypothetical protein
LESFKPTIDGWLRADLDAPKKQRHQENQQLRRQFELLHGQLRDRRQA